MQALDSQIQKKKEKRASLLKDLDELKQTWEEEERSPTPKEDEKWQNRLDELDELDDEIEELEERQDEYERVNSDINELQDDPLMSGADTNGTGGDERFERDPELHAWNARMKRKLQQTTGKQFPLSEYEERALSADIDEEGGFTVAPQQFVDSLIKFVDDQLFIRDMANVETVEDSDSLGAPSLDQDPGDAEWTAEVGTTQEDNQMDFGARELNPHKLSKLIKVSRKLLRSSTKDIDQLVRDRLGYKFSVTEEKHYLTGDGASQPLGLFTASDDGISTSRDVSTDMGTTDITADGLIEVHHSVKGQYMQNGEWMFHRDGVKRIRKLKDNNNQYIWDPAGQLGLTEDAPGTILGRPYRMSEYVPNTFTSGDYVGIFGDFDKYWIAVSMEMEVQVLQELYAENSQVGFIGRMWIDGMPVLEEAFARAQLA